MKRMIKIFSLTPLFHREEGESEVAESCLTVCDPMDCSLPGSSVHGIFKARVPEWVAFSFSRGSSQPRDWTWVSGLVGSYFYRLSHQGTPLWASLVAYLVKKIRLQCGSPRFDPWVGKIPWRRKRLPTPVFWPGEFHGLCGPWGRKELYTTEWLSCATERKCSLKVLVTSQKSQSSWGQSLYLNQFTAIFIILSCLETLCRKEWRQETLDLLST